MTDSPAVRELLNSGELQLDYLEVHGLYVQNADSSSHTSSSIDLFYLKSYLSDCKACKTR